MLTRMLTVLSIVLLAALPASAQLEQALKGLGIGTTGEPGDAKIGSGLKEALKIGTERAVRLTGKKDGYFTNQAIKILMPEKLRIMEQGLRAAGQGPKIDELVLSMNRAAEQAAPSAKQIFWNALGEMTFVDARKILTGGKTSATEYFRARTTDELTVAFTPVVEKTMEQVGVVRKYEALVGQAQSIPFVKSKPFDVNHYVVTEALDGLFYVLGEEESKIRTNPAARTTDLLQEVFGK
ncbi:MAG: DUF4197 domain-containing protein [bacterium]